MSDTLLFAIKGIVTTALIGLVWQFLVRSGMRQKAEARAREQREIRPSRRAYAILTAFFAVLTVACAIVAILYLHRFSNPSPRTVGIAALVLGLLTYYVGNYLLPAYQVTWDDQGLEGPISHKPFPFGPGRMRTDFADIVALTTDWTDSLAVIGPDGRAIRFSYLYPGFRVLVELIEEKRPDLFIYEDEDDEDDDW